MLSHKKRRDEKRLDERKQLDHTYRSRCPLLATLELRWAFYSIQSIGETRDVHMLVFKGQ